MTWITNILQKRRLQQLHIITFTTMDNMVHGHYSVNKVYLNHEDLIYSADEYQWFPTQHRQMPLRRQIFFWQIDKRVGS